MVTGSALMQAFAMVFEPGTLIAMVLASLFGLTWRNIRDRIREGDLTPAGGVAQVLEGEERQAVAFAHGVGADALLGPGRRVLRAGVLRVVVPGEQVAGRRVPGPAQIAGELGERAERGGQDGTYGESTDGFHGAPLSERGSVGKAYVTLSAYRR